MKLVITICATERYAYALTAQARRIAACIEHVPEGTVLLVGDNCEKVLKAVNLYQTILPKNWDVEHLNFDLQDNHKNYKEDAQMVIAKLRTAAFTRARYLQAEQCWSLDSDVLPVYNSLKCMQQMLEFDDGYYSISSCPYPSQGGGGFLGGRGTMTHPIADDYTIEERRVPEELKNEIEKLKSGLQTLQAPQDRTEDLLMCEMRDRLIALETQVKKFPPIGNIWEINAKFGWKKRGWLDNAYPAIGKGAILPSDWCGFGCILMNRKALSMTHFDGYQCKGTEDLYIVWNRWYQANLRINVIAHCPCDHVIRNPGKEGYFIHQQGYHETEGDAVGHLRWRSLPWHFFDEDDKWDPENDGKIVPKEPD